jgi:C1A family cysteine protease
MKKKLVGIVICTLLMGTVVPLISSSSDEQQPLAAESLIEEDCGCESHQIIPYRLTMDDTVGQSPKPTTARDIPASFSWLDRNGTDWTTSVKDQGNCGSCWDFAALGALESIIQIREGCAGLNLDLSEQYVLSCLHAAGSCNGGWAFNAYKYIKLNNSQGNYCNGIIPEFCFPYEVTDDVPCSNASPDWSEFLIPLSTYGRWVPDGSAEDRNAIKTQIMESGPVVSSMLFTIWSHGSNNLEEWGYTHHNATDYYPSAGPVQGTNHQVVLVGWKDDSSIPNGGYWIVKNSLSEEWGYHGFFNLEYGSLNIDSADINWADYNQENFSNWPPVARITTFGQTQFDGSGSFDHEGSIVSYEWDFGDGGTATGVVATYVYSSPGIYRVTLTVTDNASNTGTAGIWMYIGKENHAPETPSLIGQQTGKNGTAYNYSFSATDPDGDDVYYYLNWGDDYWFGGAVGWIGPYKSGEQVTLEKTWKKKGNYTIRVKAKDRYDARSDWAIRQVTISDVLLELTVKGGLGITAVIKNNGTTDLTNLNWSIVLDGPLIFVGKTKQGTIPSLAVEASFTIRDFIVGLGRTGIVLTVGPSVSKTNGTAILIFLVRVT